MKLPYDPKEFLTIADMQREFSYSESAVRRLIKRLKIDYVRKYGMENLYLRKDYERMRAEVETRRKVYEVIVIRETWMILESKLNFMEL